MNREELKVKIFDLHSQAQKTNFGEFLTSTVQLQGQVAKMSTNTMEAAIRFYEAMLDGSKE